MKVLVRMLLLLALLPLQVLAREVPIQDFFKDPEFTSISVSPDGKHMAVTVPQADRTVLAVLRVADQGVDFVEHEHQGLGRLLTPTGEELLQRDGGGLVGEDLAGQRRHLGIFDHQPGAVSDGLDHAGHG